MAHQAGVCVWCVICGTDVMVGQPTGQNAEEDNKKEMSLSQKHTHLSLINEKEWRFGKHFVCGTTYIQHHWELFQFNPTINPVTKSK